MPPWRVVGSEPFDASAGVPYELLADLRGSCPVSRTASGAYFLALHDDVFALDRPHARDHLAFGGGPHVCPGASLARLEGRIALEVFLDRVGTACVEDGYQREPVPVFWANGPRRLPVRLTGDPSRS